MPVDICDICKRTIVAKDPLWLTVIGMLFQVAALLALWAAIGYILILLGVSIDIDFARR